MAVQANLFRNCCIYFVGRVDVGGEELKTKQHEKVMLSHVPSLLAACHCSLGHDSFHVKGTLKEN